MSKKDVPNSLFSSLFTSVISISLLFGVSCQSPNPQVWIHTEQGDIRLELYPKQAPITVANFLRYVDEERYKPVSFYRVLRIGEQKNKDIPIEVIQGGLGFGEHPNELPAIAHETTEKTGILHTDGAISMTRYDPGTASSNFFICINDQPELDYGGMRNPDGQGFAAFGKVVAGMEVVREIQQGRLKDGEEILEEEVKILGIERVVE